MMVISGAAVFGKSGLLNKPDQILWTLFWGFGSTLCRATALFNRVLWRANDQMSLDFIFTSAHLVECVWSISPDDSGLYFLPALI
jgi:hypothetical protein